MGFANANGIRGILDQCGAVVEPYYAPTIVSPEVGVNILRREQVIRVYRTHGYPVLDSTVAQIIANKLTGVSYSLPGGSYFSPLRWQDELRKTLSSLLAERRRAQCHTMEAFTDRYTADMLQEHVAKYYASLPRTDFSLPPFAPQA